MVSAVVVRLDLKETFIRKGSIFGVKEINLEKVEFSDVHQRMMFLSRRPDDLGGPSLREAARFDQV